MEQELSAVSTFLASYLPSTASTSFPVHLEQSLATRYARHWHPEDPQRGSAYRALLRTSFTIDHDVLKAARQAGLTDQQVNESLIGKEHRVTLGERWTIWVDPGCVSLRVDRGDGGAPRDGQFIEIYGKLPEGLRNQAVSLTSIDQSLNITPTSLLVPLPPASSSTAELDQDSSSPVKRSSKAIQILPPPGGRGALQAMTNAALSPDSPAPTPARLPFALMASPHIIPPTPVRPLQPSTADGDVFSPTPAGTTLLAPPRSPSPRSYGSLSPTPGNGRPSSPLGMPNFQRRPSSRSSSVSSRTGGDSDGEASGTDSIFSAASSLDSLTTTSSSAAMWKGLDSRSRDLVDADGFRVPALPMARPGSTGPFSFPPNSHSHPRSQSHSRGSSISSLAPPPSPARSIGGTPRSQPGSPTKPRRRGVRGGQGRSENRTPGGREGHEHSTSISSISSVTSSTSSTIGAPKSPSTPFAPRPPTPSSVSGRTRTETSASSTSTSALTATEYSNGLVKVLGGGVLLGCAKSCGSARATNTTNGTTPVQAGAPGTDETGRSRRGRERRRGGRGQGGQQQPGGQGAVSPMGSFSYPSPSPISPGIMHATSPVWYPSPRH
ncbi:hypothetical protein JCM16303_001106 [Sporobolomyces ruberrimus]